MGDLFLKPETSMASSKPQFSFDEQEKKKITKQRKLYLLYREQAYEVDFVMIGFAFESNGRCIFCGQRTKRLNRQGLLDHIANPTNHNQELTISASTGGLPEVSFKKYIQLRNELADNLPPLEEEEQADCTTSYGSRSVAISEYMKTEQQRYARVCTALLEALGRGDQELYRRIVQLPPSTVDK